MLDPNLYAHDPDTVRLSLRRRHAGAETVAAAERLFALVATRRALSGELDQCRATRNRLSPVIGAAMKARDHELAAALKAEVAASATRAAELEGELMRASAEEEALALSIPNLVHTDTPDGASDADNPVVRRWGTLRAFDFEPKPHDAIAVGLRLYDPERAAKLSGSRFSVLYGALAALERALGQFFIDVQTRENGYLEVAVPYIVTRTTATGTGQLPKFEEDLFKVTAPLAGEDAFLVPTAELPVTNLHRDEVLDESALPLRYCSFTPCFRSEAGSWGRDTRGLIRQHQFHKVEMVELVHPARSAEALEALTGNAERLLQRLGLPYQVVHRCAADVGFGGTFGYDIEVWLPGQSAYREVSSCTNYGDFQARRLKTRFKAPGDKKTTLVHTLNGSGLPAGRTLVAILENYQEADGTVVVPEVLRSYLGGLDRIRPVD